MRKCWIVMMLVFGGCATTPPPSIIPARFQIGVPQANGENAVIIRGDDPNGNVYTVPIFAITNTACMDTNSPVGMAAYNDISTNKWPSKRFHLELSLDGGSNWNRRIGYGVQFDEARIHCDFQWSPPQDYNLMTTNAMIRATTLDGGTWPARSPRRPYDLPDGEYPHTDIFTIGGAVMTAPAGGSIQWQGNGTVITWRQLGAGPVMNLYWMTPDSSGVDMTHWITTISNCVDGVNSKTISLNVPEADAMRLVLISVYDQRIHGYSAVFTVDP
ncbi:MAG: hypothetical protein WCS52_01880 [bacterium]